MIFYCLHEHVLAFDHVRNVEVSERKLSHPATVVVAELAVRGLELLRLDVTPNNLMKMPDQG